MSVRASSSGEAAQQTISLQHPAHSGLQCLAAVAQYYQRPCEAEQLAHVAGISSQAVTPAQLILAARAVNLVAKPASLGWSDLPRQRFPILAELKDGNYFILARMDNGKLVVIDPTRGQLVLDQALFEQVVSGRFLRVKPRLRLGEEPRVFGLRWFVPVVLKYRKPIVEALLAAFVVQVFALAMPVFTQLVIDKVLVYRNVSTLNVLGVGMLLVIGFETILTFLKTLLITHTSNRIDVTLGARLFSHLLRLPLRYFELRTVGSTVARVRELESIRQFLTGPTLMALIDVAFVGVFLVVLLFYSVKLTLLVLAILPFMVGLSLLVFPILRRLLQRRFDTGAESQAFLVEAVTGIQTIKAMALEVRMYQRWEQSLARYVMASYDVDRTAGIAGGASQTIQRLGTLALLWVGVHLALAGDITVGELIAFQMISGQVTGPILRLAQLWQHFQQVGVSVDRIGDLMNTTPEPQIGPAPASRGALVGHVTFQNVSFRYTLEGAEVLHGVSFDIPAGSFVGVVGRSGSGKSTLMKLLQGLYQPHSGSVLVDGHDLRQTDPGWYRRQIGVVLQDNVLFSGTIRENIAIAMPDALAERVTQAAMMAGAHDFIMELADGYDTQVGERGDALSGGQRQRIAIARALLIDPRILIFDEATSALDFESERIIHRNLASIRSGRTMFFSAHRLSTIRNADLILVVDRGEIVERGTHADLVGQRGVYAELWHGEGG